MLTRTLDTLGWIWPPLLLGLVVWMTAQARRRPPSRAAKLTSLGDRPLGVVTAGKGSQPGGAALQNDLAALSTHSFHRTVAGSTHQSLIDDGQDAK